MEKGESFQQMMLEQLVIHSHIQKNETQPNLILHTKHKMDHRDRTIQKTKLLEKNSFRSLCNRVR